MPGPLEGVRVVDLSHVLNGPFATMLLAHMGAEVIKIEHGAGDRFRHSWMPVDAGRDGYESLVVNANKKCVTLNIKSPRGRAVFEDLVRVSDVVVANLSNRAMDKLGISYEELAPLNPRIIVATSTGYGRTGPYANVQAFASTIRAISGWTDTAWSIADNVARGTKDLGIGDEAAGISLALGICAALVGRATTGKGQAVDVSMVEAQLGFMVMALHTFFEGRPVGVPAAQCADGYFSFHTPDMADEVWNRLAEAMGHPEAATDERFATQAARRRHFPDVDATIREWVRPKRREELWKLFVAEGIPCAPVLSIGEMLDDETIKERQSFVEVDHPEAGPIKLLRPWIRFSDAITTITHAGPAIGEHNDEVFGKLLGLSQDEIDELTAESR